MNRFIGSHLSKNFRKTFENLFYYSNIDIDVENFLGFVISFGIGISVLVGLLLYIAFPFQLLALSVSIIGIFILILASVYMVLWFSAESKSKFVDTVLPDALNLMAVNIKSGMTTDRAFLFSARPEFGPLERQMREAGKKIVSGTEVRKAILDMTKRVKSELFERTMKLIVEGMESGGELARLLEETAQDIQKTKIIQSEVKANILMYVIFIFFASAIGAPIVYGISTNIVEILAKQSTQFDFSTLPQVPGGFQGLSLGSVGKLSLPPGFLIFYSVLAMTVTSIFGGLIIGLIKDGKQKSGVKYMPIILALSIALFFGTKIIISSLFPV